MTLFMANCYREECFIPETKNWLRRGRSHYSKARQSAEALEDTGMPPGDKSPSQSRQTESSPPRALRVA